MKTGKTAHRYTFGALRRSIGALHRACRRMWSKAAKSNAAALPEVWNNGTAIRWKYSDETDWRDLVALTELRGAAGESGKDGADGKDGTNGINGQDGKDGTNGQDGIGVSSVTVGKDGSITVTLTDVSTYKAGSISVSKEEVQALKTTAGAAAGVAGVSLVGVLSGLGYTLLKRKKLF